MTAEAAVFALLGTALAVLASVLCLRQHRDIDASRAFKLGVALFIPLCAGGMYLAVGSPGALRPAPEPAIELGTGTAAPLSEVYARLRRRIAEDPTDMRARALLFRSYLMGGRPSLALQTSKQLQELEGRTARNLAFEAQARYWMAQGEPSALVEALLQEALELQSDNEEALNLAGLLAAQREEYAAAQDYFERLLALDGLAPDRRESYRAALEEVRALRANPQDLNLDSPSGN